MFHLISKSNKANIKRVSSDKKCLLPKHREVIYQTQEEVFHLISKQYYQTLEARGGGHSHTLLIQICAPQRGRDFEALDLERGIHFRGVF